MTTEQCILLAFGIVLLFLLVANLVLIIRFSREKVIQSAFSSIQSGLDESAAQLRVYADDVRKDYRRLDQMLRTPTERGSLGEYSLEGMLADQLPKGRYSIQEECLPGRRPDASIQSADNLLICIDSKFSFANYAKMRETEEDKFKEQYRKQFIKDVKGTLEDVATKYVCPQEGTTGFAFAYVRSEAVYYFLQTDPDAWEILRAYAKRGVLTVSPITMSLALELLGRGIRDVKLNETAKEVREFLQVLAKRFDKIDEQWKLYCKHFSNVEAKEVDIDRTYKQLRQDFTRVLRDSQVSTDGQASEGVPGRPEEASG